MSTGTPARDKKIVSALKNKISRLRVAVYIFMATSVLLTCLVVFWVYSLNQDALDAFYSEATIPPSASLYLSPKEGHYSVGDEFSVDIMLNTRGSNVNAVAAYLSYNKSSIQAISIDTSNSVFPISFEQTINGAEGKIKIGLARPTPGINTNNGRVATIRFKAIAKTNPSFDDIYFDFTKNSDLYSGVFLNDKKGTNILDAIRGVKIFIN